MDSTLFGIWSRKKILETDRYWDIKVSDTQQWIIKLHNDGKGYSIQGVVKPSFQTACNEVIIRKNFGYQLSEVVSNDSQKRIATIQEQHEIWMSFIRGEKIYCKYYDEFVVQLETGFGWVSSAAWPKVVLRTVVSEWIISASGSGKYHVEKTKLWSYSKRDE